MFADFFCSRMGILEPSLYLWPLGDVASLFLHFLVELRFAPQTWTIAAGYPRLPGRAVPWAGWAPKLLSCKQKKIGVKFASCLKPHQKKATICQEKQMTFALHLAVKPPIFALEWRAWALSAPLPLHQHPVAELHPALWCPYCAFDQLGAAVRAVTVKVYRCVNMNASKIKKKHVYVYMYIKMDFVARISGFYHFWLYITIKILTILSSFACRFSLSENWYSETLS